MTMIERDMTTIIPVAHLSNEELLAEIKSLAATERHATAALVASLAELDERVTVVATRTAISPPRKRAMTASFSSAFI